MEDCGMEVLPQLQQQQPGEEAKLEKRMTETLPDEFSTLCRVASSTGGDGVNAVMQEIEVEGQMKQHHERIMGMATKMKRRKENDNRKKKKYKCPQLSSFWGTPEEDAVYHDQEWETDGFVMEDCGMEVLPQLQQQLPGEEAKLEKKMTETLPDEFSTLCRVASSTDGGSLNAVMQEIEGEGKEKQQQNGEGKQLEKKMIEGEGQEKQQQQHGEGKKMMKKKNDKKKKKKKKKKKNKRGPLKASNTRSFTPEEKEAYHKQVEETEGFGVLDLPFDVITKDVVPCPPRDTDEVMLYRGMAKKAIGFYNDDNNGASYKFVRLIRTNCRCYYVNMADFFITFQAKDGRSGGMHNFQAHILYYQRETCVLFCRVEPKSKLPEGPGATSRQS